MLKADGWRDYEVLDTGDGERLERWGDIILRRPDPQVIWPQGDPGIWGKADARYIRSSSGGGEWVFNRKLPEKWLIEYGSLRFYVRPTGFKHTGLFPEQAVNWDWMAGLIKAAKRPVRVLNLFAYTGGATLACLAAGASVCHVDAAKGMVSWAKENAELSGLSGMPARYIVDDALKFTERELRRNSRYEGILMDPPSFGRGSDGQVWKLEDKLFALVELTSGLLSESPLFFLLNGYTTGFSPSVLSNIIQKTIVKKRGGTCIANEIGLPVSAGGVTLPCGSSGRWTP